MSQCSAGKLLWEVCWGEAVRFNLKFGGHIWENYVKVTQKFAAQKRKINLFLFYNVQFLTKSMFCNLYRFVSFEEECFVTAMMF